MAGIIAFISRLKEQVEDEMMDSYALVIDPEEAERLLLRRTLSDDGWQVAEACSVEEASQIIESRPWRLIFCDAHLSVARVEDSQSIKLLDFLRARLGASVQIVMVATAGKAGTAFEAILNGAADYIRKPCLEESIREISARVRERMIAAAREKAREPLASPVFRPEIPHDAHQLIGESEAIIEVYKSLARSVRDSKSEAEKRAEERAPTFLLTGETGTGKELVARLIHRHSRYSRGTFVAINCSNLPPELADAELFGSNPGAYTGASREEQPGLWEIASGGTLFLDEITEAPISVQPKLLRVLQDGRIKRLGAKTLIKTDVQIIAASNRHFETEIGAGRFRADLYHRLNLHRVQLPPLRERQEDVPLLATYFAYLHSHNRVRLSHDAVKLLVKFSSEYPWYGNIRELENVVRRAVRQAPDATVYAVDLTAHLPPRHDREPLTEGGLPGEKLHRDAHCRVHLSREDEGLEERVSRFRRGVVKDTLAAHNGNRSRAANALGVSRPKLHRLLKELNKHD